MAANVISAGKIFQEPIHFLPVLQMPIKIHYRRPPLALPASPYAVLYDVPYTSVIVIQKQH